MVTVIHGIAFTEAPEPGRWKIVVDATRPAGGVATPRDVDVVTSPRYGRCALPRCPTGHTPARSSARAHVWPAGRTGPGREPAALSLVTSDDVRARVPTPAWGRIAGRPGATPMRAVRVPLGWAAVLFDGATA